MMKLKKINYIKGLREIAIKRIKKLKIKKYFIIN
jgi:hypothetical protein